MVRSSAPQSSASQRSYHHGGVRVAAIEAGLRLLETADAEDFSLRAIAREIGVSATALYRHFPDKAALLSALAREGLDRLAAAQQAASQASGDGVAGFSAAGRTYVRFGLEHPALFRMIMSHMPATDHFSDDSANVSSPMRYLRESIARLLPPDADAATHKAAALRAWAMVHGLTQLILDGHVSLDDGTLIDRVIDDSDFWKK
jgi:AcrR family transcriptional regulator